MKMRTIISVILIIIFIFIVDASGINMQERHNSLYCFSCHDQNGLSGYPTGGEDECGNCHILYNKGINFSEKHEQLSCDGCHIIGTKNDFHLIHTKNTSCITCHIDNTLPEANYSKCLDCHVSGLHSTHIEKSCELCHKIKKQTPTITPKFVQKCDEFDCWNEYIYENNTTNETKSINTSKPITNYKKLTIYEILVNLIKAIRDDIYE